MNVTRYATQLGIAVCLAVGCAATRQASVEDGSGFLGTSYSLMKPGKDKQAKLVYIKPGAAFQNYDKVWLAPVVVWRSKGSKLSEYSREDLQLLANRAYSAFAKSLSTHVRVVGSPQPGSLKVELVITDVDRSEPVLDTISSLVPQARTLATLKGIVSGKPGFVGEASGEVKVTDAETGELLLAGMDRRVGTKNVSGVTNSWNDVEHAIDYWAEAFSYNLCVNRGGKSCAEPSA